jgi:hypothetical protein
VDLADETWRCCGITQDILDDADADAEAGLGESEDEVPAAGPAKRAIANGDEAAAHTSKKRRQDEDADFEVCCIGSCAVVVRC